MLEASFRRLFVPFGCHRQAGASPWSPLFFPLDRLERMTCAECGEEIPIGGWPWCPHSSVYPEWAQPFAPMVYDRDAVTGQISYPGSSHDPVPEGYVRHTLSTINQVDDFCRARTDEETSKKRDQIRAEKQYWDQRIQERREFVRAEMKRRGFKGKAFEAITRFLDARREAKYAKLLNQEVNVFSDVISYDSSNREPHSSPATGWRNRKA